MDILHARQTDVFTLSPKLCQIIRNGVWPSSSSSLPAGHVGVNNLLASLLLTPMIMIMIMINHNDYDYDYDYGYDYDYDYGYGYDCDYDYDYDNDYDCN